MKDTMPDSFFKQLDDDEVREYRQWARDNHKPGDKVSGLWHPVIREECKLIDLEAKSLNQNKEPDSDEESREEIAGRENNAIDNQERNHNDRSRL